MGRASQSKPDTASLANSASGRMPGTSSAKPKQEPVPHISDGARKGGSNRPSRKSLDFTETMGAVPGQKPSAGDGRERPAHSNTGGFIMKIWAKTEEFSEGKYLVVRRDGTVPSWPHFVLGGDDPCAPAALEQYAHEAERRCFDLEYVGSIRELSSDFSRRTGGKADPDAGPHRQDLPLAIAMMRGKLDVAGIAAALSKIAEIATENDDGAVHRIACIAVELLAGRAL